MENNNQRSTLLPLIISAAVVVGVLVGMFAGRYGAEGRLGGLSGELRNPSSKLSYALSLIDKYYVEPVNMDSLVDKVMPQLMWNLDPHSVYIPASEMTSANEALDGEFDGIGVVFNMSTDTILVINVVSQGPSHKAGVQNGDRIIKVNDSIVAGRKMKQEDVMKMLRGPRGTEVRLSVLRSGIKDLVPITVTRGKIPVKSINAAYMIAPDVAFVRITAFSQFTYDEMMRIMENLRGQGMKNLIIDLRGNTGGFLGQPVLMANEFLPEGKLIVYTEDRNGRKIKEYSDGNGEYQNIGLAVLIDEQSASSSEIFAGALQDNDRATIIGRRSFGKGLVQQQMPFMDGSAIRLTTAKYYTPTGRSIQKPYTNADAGYEDDIYNRYKHNELFSADSIHFSDSLKFVTAGGRVVYGGGGIMPDVFVPLDTLDVTKYYLDVAGRNILYRYTVDYADRHRAKINAVGSVAELNVLLDADKNLLNDFVKYAARNGVAPDWTQIRKSEKLLKALLRGYIGRNTPLEEDGFYSNFYVVDPPVLKALDELGSTDTKR